MKPNDRARLTTALRDHVGKIAADLRAKMRAPGYTRVRAQQLHADEKVAEDFDVWTDLLSRRASVLWVLKSVYVRVLEDRGLLTPGRLLDQEAQQLFERLAPHLGETAFLRWVYRDLASSHGGLPELFSPQPAEVALPSDELSRALIAFWRHRDADTGATWSFAEERFEGELMGDLYQELDPVVKDRFALCQTPDFVRAFILDRTLTPAIETFGAEEVRLLDPACGSGHFLIDGLKRLVAATGAKHPDWERGKLVAHALDRVVGVDLNDYACALARARLIMTASELAGVTSLAEAARFHPHVYWADGLEQVEREEQKPALQYALFEKVEEKPRATLTRSDVRAALRKVFATKFHAVVANPPYIAEADEARREYHRELVSRKRRYVSATGKYSLGSPFIERCFQLGSQGAYVGVITSNNFMKRSFGKSLVEEVLANVDVSMLVDLSQAYIPHHSTPTVLIFARNRLPVDAPIRAVMGKRGEVGTPEDPSRGAVWVDIETAWNQPGHEGDFISVADQPRDAFATHPWSLQGGGALDLKSQLDALASETLGQFADSIGVIAVTLQDEVFLVPSHVFRRAGVIQRRPAVLGDGLRDWRASLELDALFPYSADGTAGADAATLRWLWPFREPLRRNLLFGKTKEQRKMKWFEYGMLIHHKMENPVSIALAAVASHNHFVLIRGHQVFTQSSIVTKLPGDVADDVIFALLGILNSSTACFWMKQVFYPKGSKTHDVDKEGTLPENNRYDFAATGMKSFPLPLGWKSSRIADLARELVAVAEERDGVHPARVLERLSRASAPWPVSVLTKELTAASERDSWAERRMCFLQEELDWAVYDLYGLADAKATATGVDGIEDDARPFRANDVAVSRLHSTAAREYTRRARLIDASAPLSLLETPVYKRLWRGVQGIFGRYDRTYDERSKTALKEWIAERLEEVVQSKQRPLSTEQIAAIVQDDPQFLAVAEVLESRRDFSVARLVVESMGANAVPSHPFHIYKPSGLVKRAAWEKVWSAQRRSDAGSHVDVDAPPTYVSADFLRPDHWQLRGKLDVPKERFIAFSEVPGRNGADVLYGWAGWTALQRLKALLALDEELDDAGVAIRERIGILDSAWRLLPDVSREDDAAATRLKAELQAVVGPNGPSRELLDEWQGRLNSATAKPARPPRARNSRAKEVPPAKETDES